MLQGRLKDLTAALEEAGRDPVSITRTAGIFVAFTDDPDAPENAIRGTTEQIAETLARYAEYGISHLIAHTWPRSPDGVKRLAEAAAVARERVGVPI